MAAVMTHAHLVAGSRTEHGGVLGTVHHVRLAFTHFDLQTPSPGLVRSGWPSGWPSMHGAHAFEDRHGVLQHVCSQQPSQAPPSPPPWSVRKEGGRRLNKPDLRLVREALRCDLGHDLFLPSRSGRPSSQVVPALHHLCPTTPVTTAHHRPSPIPTTRQLREAAAEAALQGARSG